MLTWSALVEWNEAAFRDELVDLLADELGAEAGTHLDVLRTLGALTTVEGRTIVEPVLAAAWRASRAAD